MDTFLAAALITAAMGGLGELAERFSGCDLDGDGVREIERLALAGDAAPGSGPLVLLLVEERLAGDARLMEALARHQRDLAAEGWREAIVRAELHRGERHQDGRLVLALREFLRAVRREDAGLAGVLLVGRFPEAYLVRSVNWRKRTELVLHAGQDGELRFAEPVDYLRTVAEPVAHTCDLVLADLDGGWERLYAEPRERLATLHAVFAGGVPAGGGVTSAFEWGHVEYEDYFHVDDGHYEAREVLDAGGAVTALRVTPLDDVRDFELAPADRARPNPIARPELLVSRIDASGVALAPRPEYLDAAGLPRAVAFAAGEALPAWHDGPYRHDPEREMELLLACFERNHLYRAGASGAAAAPVVRRPASLAHDLGSGYEVVRAAAAEWRDEDRPRLDVHGRPALAAAAEWLKQPALLRTVRAHSDRFGSQFEASDVAALEQIAGGTAWCWSPAERALVPSLRAACQGGRLDFFLLDTLQRNGVLPGSPCFYLHTGCEAMSPAGAENLPYHHPRYGLRNGAAALLFLGGGLALVGRAKVFYDEPRGFSAVLREGGTFGAGWARYFEVESQAATWAEVGDDIGRKRSYFWSMLGDWTLCLAHEPAAARPPAADSAGSR